MAVIEDFCFWDSNQFEKQIAAHYSLLQISQIEGLVTNLKTEKLIN